MATIYFGTLDGSGDVWGVCVPDLPGAYGGGATPDEAIESAIEAARIVAAHYEGKGKAVPLPRGADEIRQLADEGERVVPIRISR